MGVNVKNTLFDFYNVGKKNLIRNAVPKATSEISNEATSSIKTISVFVHGEASNFVVSDFKKNKITFGRDETNDIVISSLFVSKFHGYFELIGDDLWIVDNDSKNGILINDEVYQKKKIEVNDIIRIDNEESRVEGGALILVRFDDVLRNWSSYSIDTKSDVLVGNKNECDILLTYNNLTPDYVIIKKKDKHFSLFPLEKEVCVNGRLIHGEVVLTDHSVISFEGVSIIYFQAKILYQSFEKGVKVIAQDVCKTVRVRGKKKDIAQHINMQINPGEFVAFVGGSGAGKSTFMSCISGLMKPTKGKVLINGVDLYQNYETLKNIIGYVPQDDIVFTDLTLSDMLSYSANLRMPDEVGSIEKERRIQEVLEIVDLTDAKNVKIKRLSGGQRKRTSIAIELLADPRLFFLDEPTSGLDPGTERSIMKTLRKMSEDGRTVILVTHNTLNLHLCDKVVFFGRGGRVCYDGSPNGAKEFFGVDDFVDIYNLIEEDVSHWHQKFTDSQEEIRIKENEEKTEKVKVSKKHFFSQCSTLVRRYLKTIFNNRFQTFLLLFQAPVISFLLSLIITNDLFEYYDVTKSILFSISLAGTYIGLGNSIQEICKERVILKKEYMSNLRLSAYLSSKVIVLLFLSIIQAFLLIFSLKLFIAVPVDGVVFRWDLEMVIESSLTIFAASTIGLVVSTLASNPSAAMAYIPILLVPQMLFSGMLFELDGITEFLSYFMLCRWSLELLGTTNDMNNMVSLIQDVVPGYKREAELFFEFTSKHFYEDIIIICVMALVLIGICYFILKKQLEVKK